MFAGFVGFVGFYGGDELLGEQASWAERACHFASMFFACWVPAL